MVTSFQPIIKSLLDTDFYKLTMGQLVFRKYRDIPVKYEFINRSRDLSPVGDWVRPEEIAEQLNHVQNLGISKTEYRYLKGISMHTEPLFKDDYLQFLRDLRMPDFSVGRDKEGEIALSFEGPWAKTIYWETIALCIINELYFKNRYGGDYTSGSRAWAQGYVRVCEKIDILKANPDIMFTDFGTRRRFSQSWHSQVLAMLQKHLSPNQFLGTSNVLMAMLHELDPIGTLAHELFMVMAAYNRTDNDIRESHNAILRDWYAEYGFPLSCALTDTFGSDFFFRDFTQRQAHSWKMLRQDSGMPLVFVDKAIKFYQEMGVSPKDKTIVFSDGLDLGSMRLIADYCKGKIGCVFGWGTNLTNDCGPEPLSIVVKVTEAAGLPAVKLSDNLNKATGNPDTVERYKRIFGYANDYKAWCQY